MNKLDNAIIVVTKRSFPAPDDWLKYKFDDATQVYAIRKFSPQAKYKNVILSLCNQLRNRYDTCLYLTPKTFEQEYEICVHTFDKKGWPVPVGDLRDWLR